MIIINPKIETTYNEPSRTLFRLLDKKTTSLSICMRTVSLSYKVRTTQVARKKAYEIAPPSAIEKFSH